MFSCRDATNLMTEESDGALHGVRGVRYRFHMLLCPHCKVFRRQLDETIAIVKEIPRAEPPTKTEDDLAAAFRARTKAE
jgi:hypothetical protein